MILLGVCVGNLGITIVGETKNDYSLASKLCAVDASRGVVNAYLDSSLDNRNPGTRRGLTGN